MKKWIISAVVLALLLVLFLPIPQGVCRDGGTRVYQALTYKIVKWNRMIDIVYDDGRDITKTYQNTSVFWFPDNQKDSDELWEIEKERNRSDIFETDG